MSKRPTDHLEPSSKKRNQDRQGRKGDEDDEGSEPEDPGQFAKASEAVLKTRRILKARRGGGGLAATGAAPAAAPAANGAAAAEAPAKSANPFAGVNLFAPSKAVQASAPAAPAAAPAASEQAEAGSKDAVAGVGADSKDEAATSSAAAGVSAAAGEKLAEKVRPAAEPAAEAPATDAPAREAGTPEHAGAPMTSAPATTPSAEGSSAVPPPAQPANNGGSKGGFSFGSNLTKSVGSGFGGLAGASGGGFAAFASQSAAAGGSEAGGILFGSKPAFAFGSTASADTTSPAPSVFGRPSAGAAQEKKPAAAALTVLAPDAAVETGEEGERTVFSGDGTLFGFNAGGWKERGRGELRVKINQTGQARIIMRQRGNLRLLLNANLWEDMAVNIMDGGLGVTFALQNAAAAPAEGGEAAGTPDKDNKPELSTYAFRVKTKQALEDFKTAVERYRKADAAAANV